MHFGRFLFAFVVSMHVEIMHSLEDFGPVQTAAATADPALRARRAHGQRRRRLVLGGIATRSAMGSDAEDGLGPGRVENGRTDRKRNRGF